MTRAARGIVKGTAAKLQLRRNFRAGQPRLAGARLHDGAGYLGALGGRGAAIETVHAKVSIGIDFNLTIVVKVNLKQRTETARLYRIGELRAEQPLSGSSVENLQARI